MIEKSPIFRLKLTQQHIATSSDFDQMCVTQKVVPRSISIYIIRGDLSTYDITIIVKVRILIHEQNNT